MRLAEMLDRACLVLSEGQFLDLSFEERQSVPVTLYLEMIRHKTATLLGCAAEMGALLSREPPYIPSLQPQSPG